MPTIDERLMGDVEPLQLIVDQDNETFLSTANKVDGATLVVNMITGEVVAIANDSWVTMKQVS